MKDLRDMREIIRELLRGFSPERRNLINFLHLIQSEVGYIPEEGVELLAENFSVSPAEIYSVATFYSSFRIERPPEHEIQVCQGTACHVRRADAIFEEFTRQLEKNFGPEKWSKQVALKKVNCLGCCAIGPVAMVDGKIESKVTPARVQEIVARLVKDGNGQRNKKNGQGLEKN